MTLSPGAPAPTAGDLYHDIYDFSVFPVSLGDLLNWGVKSALRAQAAGRSRVHVHVVCDPQMAELNPLQASTYLVDLFVVEAIPAFYSHPLFSGLSLYRSRGDFRAAFASLARDDAASREVFDRSEELFRRRADFDFILSAFRHDCSDQRDINACFARTGRYPQVGFLRDCLVDWRALQAQFSQRTFWVGVQFRLRRLDAGMPVTSEEGLRRDAAFSTWFDFMREAAARFPAVRFVVVGRLQEKPLELLRLPNVVTLRPLGMNLAHEIAALLHSDHYLGSSSGFAQVGHFSSLPYDVFNVTDAGCGYFGIPYGTRQLPIATPHQRLHYGPETTELLLDCLEQACQRAEPRSIPGDLETSRTRSTDRFFLHERQNEAELANVLSARVLAAALAIERGELKQAHADLRALAESFPVVAGWPDVRWLSRAAEDLLAGTASAERREQVLWEISAFCHPPRLICWSGRYFDQVTVSEGFRRDGWCEQKALLVFAPSRPGDFVYVRVRRLAGSEPVGLNVRINDQPAVPFVLLNEHASLEIPVRAVSIPTRVRLESDRAGKLSPRDETAYAFQIEAAGLIAGQAPVSAVFRADKKSPREKVVSGLYANGVAGNLVRIRVDHPPTAGQRVMVQVTGTVPRPFRRGQRLRAQINDEAPVQAVITGKRFVARLPSAGASPHLTVLLQFGEAGEAPSENRALIQAVEALPATVGRPEIRSGLSVLLAYGLERLRAGKARPGPASP
jgi:hypothetical protein